MFKSKERSLPCSHQKQRQLHDFSTVRKTTFIEALSCLGEMKNRCKNPGEKKYPFFSVELTKETNKKRMEVG